MTLLKVTMTLSTKKLENLAVLGARTLKLRRDVGPSPVDDTEAKVKDTFTSSTKQVYNSAMLGVGPSNIDSRDVSYDQKMTLRAEVMVKVIMTFKIASLLAVLCMT